MQNKFSKSQVIDAGKNLYLLRNLIWLKPGLN